MMQANQTLAPRWVAIVAALGFALAAGAAHAQSTTDYVRQSAMTDLFEITSGRVALEKSQNSAVRDFAQRMMSDHGRATAEFKRALKAGKVLVTVPTALDPRHEQEIAELQKKPDDQFDQAYLQSQIEGHRNALDTQRAYAQSGDNAALKKFAAQASSRVEGDLVKLETLAQDARVARMCRVSANLRDLPG